jgi:hypothetical protein
MTENKEKKVRVTLDLTPDEFEQLKELTVKSGSTTKAEALRKAIRKGLEKGDIYEELKKALDIIKTLVAKLPDSK